MEADEDAELEADAEDGLEVVDDADLEGVAELDP